MIILMTQEKKKKTEFGQETKFYKPGSTGSGRVTIPISLARSLGWEHKDSLFVKIKTISNEIGLFISKKEEE